MITDLRGRALALAALRYTTAMTGPDAPDVGARGRAHERHGDSIGWPRLQCHYRSRCPPASECAPHRAHRDPLRGPTLNATRGGRRKVGQDGPRLAAF
jgi:hypothetical protein